MGPKGEWAPVDNKQEGVDFQERCKRGLLDSLAYSPLCSTPAYTHPSTSGKSRIRAHACSRRRESLVVSSVVEALGVPGVVGMLEELGVVWLQVTHGDGTRSSTPTKNSQCPRVRRLSARRHSRPNGCMVLSLGLRSLTRAGIGQRVTMGFGPSIQDT